MATYVIGDVHGCYRTLKKLLGEIGYEKKSDRLWMVGDLVNRGPRSLDVLRWATDQGERLTLVLGNHDLHLISCADGLRQPKSRDTITPVLDAPDGAALVSWIAERPLIHREDPWVMVHAGLAPIWTLEQAEEIARRLEQTLRDPAKRRPLLTAWRAQEKPTHALRTPSCDGDALAIALCALTRLRICTSEGTMNLTFTGPREDIPPGYLPWFEAYHLAQRPTCTLLFGHWAALGLYRGDHVFSLDTGCMWGRTLTALRLEDRTLFHQPYAD